MKGFGKSFELGQSMANAGKAVADATQLQQGAKVVQQQVKTLVGQGGQQPHMTEAFGGLGKLFETGQGTQQQNSPLPQQHMPQQPVNLEEKYRPQKIADQNALAAARRNLQELEQEMERISREREEKWAKMNEQEKEEKKMEELQVEKQKKQQPVTAASRNPEGGKKKG